jgi:hypothetical protein
MAPRRRALDPAARCPKMASISLRASLFVGAAQDARTPGTSNRPADRPLSPPPPATLPSRPGKDAESSSSAASPPSEPAATAPPPSPPAAAAAAACAARALPPAADRRFLFPASSTWCFGKPACELKEGANIMPWRCSTLEPCAESGPGGTTYAGGPVSYARTHAHSISEERPRARARPTQHGAPGSRTRSRPTQTGTFV